MFQIIDITRNDVAGVDDRERAFISLVQHAAWPELGKFGWIFDLLKDCSPAFWAELAATLTELTNRVQEIAIRK